MTNFSELR